MDLHTKVAGKTIKFAALEHTNGQMAEYTQETGKITTCMDKESIHGLMAVVTKENT